MDDEIIIIIAPRRQQLASDAETEASGIRRTFTGPDRYKKARKFINALAEVDSED